jgi:uncharacterized protein (TIGR02284 family)
LSSFHFNQRLLNMTEHNKDTRTLNTLIATLLDSVEGYEKSADDIGNAALTEKFRNRVRERQAVVAKLQAVVDAAGGEPHANGSVLGAAHRMVLNFKEAVAGKDDKAIVAEIERGEDYLKEKFNTALAEPNLSPTARQAVQDAWQSVRAGHEEMSALKHSTGA